MKEFGRDMLSTILFVALYLLLGDIFLATGVAIAAGIVQIGYLKLRGRQIDAMQWMSLALVVVFGGATLYLHDPRFVMVKPSVIHFAIGSVMLRKGWMRRYLSERAVENLSARMIDGWSYAWAALMFGLGAANIVIALEATPQIWAYFNSFGAIAAQIALFSVQYLTMRKIVLRRLAARAVTAA
jgi:intracellular septation protein A